jgi:phosphate transport system substrate-binding protein
MRQKLNKGPIAFIVVVAAGTAGLWYSHSRATAPVPVASAELPADAPGPPQPASSASVRLCGSNTIGAELAPALADEFLTAKGATDVRRESAGGSVVVSGLFPGEARRFSVEVRSAGTGTAFKEMAAGRCDIAMASRDAFSDELAMLGPGATEHVLGLDGIAIIVNDQSPVVSLDISQIAAVFSGSASSWSAVGGRQGSVDVVSYDEKSGTYDTFKRVVLGDLVLVPSSRRFSTSADVVRAVAGSPSAVAYTSLSAARGVKVLPVAEVGSPPVAPTVWTVARESYPLTRRLLLYTSPDHSKSAANTMVLFAMSNTGQAVVSRCGFVDLSVKAEPASACPLCPAQYAQDTAGYRRLSVDFRFRNGSADLDSRASEDAERVVAFVRPGSSVRLVGFADNSGSPSVNQKLSLDRAERVRSALVGLGLQSATSFGMGSLMPAASNATEPGRQRNRRVEVWVSGQN